MIHPSASSDSHVNEKACPSQVPKLTDAVIHVHVCLSASPEGLTMLLMKYAMPTFSIVSKLCFQESNSVCPRRQKIPTVWSVM